MFKNLKECKNFLIVSALLFLVGLIAYLPSFYVAFQLDDIPVIVSNPLMRTADVIKPGALSEIG